MARITTGARGIGRVLVGDGFKYQFNRQSLSTMHWRCWRTTCSAKLKTNLFDRNEEDPNIMVVERGQHDHEEDDAVIQKGIFLNDVKGSIKEDPTRPIKRVYDQQFTESFRLTNQIKRFLILNLFAHKCQGSCKHRRFLGTDMEK